VSATNHPFVDLEDFNLHEGVTVGFKAVGGKTFFGTITTIDRNKETGEIKINVDPASVYTARDE